MSVYRRPVPEELWKPLAFMICWAHRITIRQLLFGDPDLRFAIPRARFWTRLRRKGYSLPAIAEISGHHHTTVLSGLRARTRRMRYEQLKRQNKELPVLSPLRDPYRKAA